MHHGQGGPFPAAAAPHQQDLHNYHSHRLPPPVIEEVHTHATTLPQTVCTGKGTHSRGTLFYAAAASRPWADIWVQSPGGRGGREDRGLHCGLSDRQRGRDAYEKMSECPSPPCLPCLPCPSCSVSIYVYDMPPWPPPVPGLSVSVCVRVI